MRRNDEMKLREAGIDVFGHRVVLRSIDDRPELIETREDGRSCSEGS